MTASAKQTSEKPEAAVVLSKAVARAAERLDVPKSLLAKVLGLSPPTITRLYSGNYLLDPNRKEWDFALLLCASSARWIPSWATRAPPANGLPAKTSA